METQEFNSREVEILKAIPKSQVLDFVEKNGQKLRSLIESDEELNDQEILEALIEWYKWL